MKGYLLRPGRPAGRRPGKDVLSGGAGNDTILARDKTRDVITCGPGRDIVTADRIDAVARDCETVRRR